MARKYDLFTVLDKSKTQLQLAMQALTLLGLIFTAYITYRLVPVYKNIDSLNFRVEAIEGRNKAADPLIPRFIIIEEKVSSMVDNIKEIKVDVKEIKAAIK